jgi:IMP dehydrogenase
MNPVAQESPLRSLTDRDFYLGADEFFRANRPTALTFDDISLATLFSDILPRTPTPRPLSPTHLRLPIPIISSDMDTVTESKMAITMALNGGLGIVHYNMSAREQVKEIARVKRHIHGLIQDPITVSPINLSAMCSR